MLRDEVHIAYLQLLASLYKNAFYYSYHQYTAQWPIVMDQMQKKLGVVYHDVEHEALSCW